MAELVISTLGKNPEREKMIDSATADAPFFQPVFAAKSTVVKHAADPVGNGADVARGARRS